MSDPREWGVLYDCDGTLIGKVGGALMPTVSRRGLPKEASKELAVMRTFYVGLYESGAITEAQYRHWLIEEIALYVRYELKADDWRRALSHVRLREGAVELIRELHQLGVRQAVVSAAVADFVEFVLEVNGVRGMIDAVYAARLVHDADGIVVDHVEETIVHIGNKGSRSLDFAARFSLHPHRLIAIGDSIGDAALGHLLEHRIGVAETEIEAERLRALGIMGEVVVILDQRLHPVSAVVKRKLGLLDP
ncbi:MAG: haloacid dehalogenase-like hydrolase [Patescibacteria group bacterium]